MRKLTFRDFDAIYQSSVDEIWPFWSEAMQAEIARHCIAWSPGHTDFLDYLRLSAIRFFKAYESLAASGSKSVCDVGGFWGVWPMTAKRIGFDVAMTESFRFYGNSFEPLFGQIAAAGVDLFDYDPFSSEPALRRTFDFVTVMALIEHYPHSLRRLVENLKQLTGPKGQIFFEVPNIAYWPKRVALLRGETPLAQLADIYLSEEPFIGHHHEMTIAEMRDLARLGRLEIISEHFYNYSLADKSRLRLWLRHPVLSFAVAMSRTSRECIAVVCRKQLDG